MGREIRYFDATVKQQSFRVLSHSHSFVPATIWLLGNCVQLYCKYWKYTSCSTIVFCNRAYIWWSLCGTWIW